VKAPKEYPSIPNVNQSTNTTAVALSTKGNHQKIGKKGKTAKTGGKEKILGTQTGWEKERNPPISSDRRGRGQKDWCGVPRKGDSHRGRAKRGK